MDRLPSPRNLTDLCKNPKHFHDALRMASLMDQQGLRIPRDAIYELLQHCARRKDLTAARQVQFLMINNKLDSIPVLADHLIRIFTLCGSLVEACRAFRKVVTPTVFTWNAIISAHISLDKNREALLFYANMQHQEEVIEDKVTFLSIIKACASPGSVTHGRQIHDKACCTIEAVQCGRVVHHVLLESDNASDTMIGSTIMDMYIKCGSLMDACKVFDGVLNHDVALWGSLIAGYACYGDIDRAVLSLQHMQQEGLEPDEMVLTCIISACSQHGMVEEGHKYFEFMGKHKGNFPNVEHYNGMVDLLTRAGSLEEASCLLQTMPVFPDSIGWRCLLAGCRLYGNISLASQCFDELTRLDPCDSSAYALMIDIYTKAQMWDDVERLQQLRREAHMHSECKETCEGKSFYMVDGQ